MTTFKARNKTQACMKCSNLKYVSVPITVARHEPDTLECGIDPSKWARFVSRDRSTMINTYECDFFKPLDGDA